MRCRCEPVACAAVGDGHEEITFDVGAALSTKARSPRPMDGGSLKFGV